MKSAERVNVAKNQRKSDTLKTQFKLIAQMGVTMRKKKSQATAPANQPIKLETVYPINIKDKTGGFSLAAPGETIEYEELDTVKIIMLAHKFNEMVIQMHRMQKVVFANNKMLAELLEQKNAKETDTKKQ